MSTFYKPTRFAAALVAGAMLLVPPLVRAGVVEDKPAASADKGDSKTT